MGYKSKLVGDSDVTQSRDFFCFIDLSFPGMLLTNMVHALFLYQLMGREKEEVEASSCFFPLRMRLRNCSHHFYSRPYWPKCSDMAIPSCQGAGGCGCWFGSQVPFLKLRDTGEQLVVSTKVLHSYTSFAEPFFLCFGDTKLFEILDISMLSHVSAPVCAAVSSRNTFAFPLSQLNSCSSSKINLRCYFLQENVLCPLFILSVSGKCFFKRYCSAYHYSIMYCNFCIFL